jgi:lysyl-tRNA synthetase class II
MDINPKQVFARRVAELREKCNAQAIFVLLQDENGQIQVCCNNCSIEGVQAVLHDHTQKRPLILKTS